MKMRRQTIATSPTCPRCGAAALFSNARFCGHCGAPLTGGQSGLPEWQRPATAKYQHVVMSRMALSCPECGYAMRFGFRKVCRRCGAKLVMVPRLFHVNHVRIYVAGPRAAFTALVVECVHWVIAIAALTLIVKACVPTK
ncbi:MAG TPA: zinc ribbon domain-containing protein [Candidatus Binataceae bacterium]